MYEYKLNLKEVRYLKKELKEINTWNFYPESFVNSLVWGIQKKRTLEEEITCLKRTEKDLIRVINFLKENDDETLEKIILESTDIHKNRDRFILNENSYAREIEEKEKNLEELNRKIWFSFLHGVVREEKLFFQEECGGSQSQVMDPNDFNNLSSRIFSAENVLKEDASILTDLVHYTTNIVLMKIVKGRDFEEVEEVKVGDVFESYLFQPWSTNWNDEKVLNFNQVESIITGICYIPFLNQPTVSSIRKDVIKAMDEVKELYNQDKRIKVNVRGWEFTFLKTKPGQVKIPADAVVVFNEALKRAWDN